MTPGKIPIRAKIAKKIRRLLAAHSQNKVVFTEPMLAPQQQSAPTVPNSFAPSMLSTAIRIAKRQNAGMFFAWVIFPGGGDKGGKDVVWKLCEKPPFLRMC